MNRLILFFLFAAVLNACSGASSGPLKVGAHWREVSSIDDGFIPMVTVDADHAHDGKVYQEAAASLSSDPHTFQIGFFLPGDNVPSDQTRQSFFSTGGWEGFSPAAVWDKDGFTKWDCNKAGVDDAPLSALCGEGAQEQYDAVLHIAGRDAWVEGCHSPPIDGKSVVERFAATFTDAKKQQLLSAYEQFYNESRNGPDDPQDCVNLREKMDSNAADGKRLLLKATRERLRRAGES